MTTRCPGSGRIVQPSSAGELDHFPCPECKQRLRVNIHAETRDPHPETYIIVKMPEHELRY